MALLLLQNRLTSLGCTGNRSHMVQEGVHGGPDSHGGLSHQAQGDQQTPCRAWMGADPGSRVGG